VCSLKYGYANSDQVRAIRTLASKIFADDNEYHDSLEQNFGVRSCKSLTIAQASSFVKNLSSHLSGTGLSSSGSVHPRASGTFNKYTGRGVKGRQKHLTAYQAERIELLEKLLGWKSENTTVFVSRQVKLLKGVEMLMNWEAVKVIVGMQKILSSNLKTEYAVINAARNSELKNYLGTK